MKMLLRFGLVALTLIFLSAFLYSSIRETPKSTTGDGAETDDSESAVHEVLHAALRFRFSQQIRDLRHVSGARLTTEPTIAENGATVAVSWDHVSVPRASDWVGLYCPPGAESRAYLDHSFVTDYPSFAKGRGSLRFTVYNLRTECEFRYYQNTSDHTTLLAVSNKVSFRGGKQEPLQGHLALTGDPTQMRVSWTTGTSSPPVVYYGTSRDNLTLYESGISKTYTIFDMCGPPANDSAFFLDPGNLHDVLLTDLKPKTTYSYKFGSEGIFSDVKTFTTAIPAGDPTPFQFIMYGDMGLSPPPGAQRTAQLVLGEIIRGAAFVMNQGDLSYAVGRAAKWDEWMSLIEPYATLAPYMISIGNHEYDHIGQGSKDPSGANGQGFHPEWGNYGHDSAGECGVPPFYRFHMPDIGNSVFWYSYDYGLVHIVAISTEHNFTRSSPMYEWIEKDLKSVNKGLTPWLIVVGHRAMYISEKYPEGQTIMFEMQKALEDLFYTYRVDLAVWGHFHSYERTCAVKKGVCDPNGTVHIVVGSAGFELDGAGIYNFPWSRHYEKSFGYLRVSVANASALKVEYIRNIDKAVADQVWLHGR